MTTLALPWSGRGRLRRTWGVRVRILSQRFLARHRQAMHRPEPTPESASEASDRVSSASEDLDRSPALKKRKSTYYARKEAITVLHSRVHELEQELAQAQATSKTTPHLVKDQFAAQIKHNHQLFAGLASLLSSYKQATRSSGITPLATYIHLSKCPIERDRELQALHKTKVEAAYHFMTERTRFLDRQLKHSHEELVHEYNGDAVSVRLEVTSFERRFSIRQVYEALKFYLANQEKILTGDADMGKSRGDFDLDFQHGQLRVSSRISGHPRFSTTELDSTFMSSPESGDDMKVESNSVVFLSFVEEPKASTAFGPCAVVASDFVDNDERHEGEPHSGVLEQLTSAVLVTETVTPKGTVVTISRWEHSRFRAPLDEPLTRLQIEQLHAMGKQRWETMLQVIHERLEALW